MQEKEQKFDFMIQKLLSAIVGNKVSKEEWSNIMGALDKEIKERPFRVAVIGQSGVGKSTTLNSVFGIQEHTSKIAEGTTDIVEKKFEMRDGFNLSIYDMPGLNNDVEKDIEYEKMYRKILPDCDVIVYIINAHSRDLGEDCRILKDVVLPICNANSLCDNLILAFNKIDTIGETDNPNDPELKWDIINNRPTEKLKVKIKIKLQNLIEKLIDEHIIEDGKAESIQASQVVFYSAVFNYNLGDFLKAITNAGNRGWIWTSTVGMERIGKWSDKKLN